MNCVCDALVRLPKCRLFFLQYRGSVTVEMAVLLPFLVAILYSLFDIGLYLLAQQRVNRATTALAELMINEPQARASVSPQSLVTEIADTQESWLPIVRDILQITEINTDGAEGENISEGAVGVSVHYHYADSDQSFQQGPSDICPEDTATTLKTALGNEALEAPETIAPLHFIVVKLCQRYAHNQLSVARLVLPEILASHFLTVRKDWRRKSLSGPPPRPPVFTPADPDCPTVAC